MVNDSKAKMISFGYIAIVAIAFFIANMVANRDGTKVAINEFRETYEVQQEELLAQIDDLGQQITYTRTELQTQVDMLKEAQIETKILEMRIQMDEVEKITDTKERYLAYMGIVEQYKDWIDMPETIYDWYTDNEIYYLQRMVETETHGADIDSKINVANVVFNRLFDDEWPDDMISVITQPNQFAYGRISISDSTKLACEIAFAFADTTNGALAFHSNSTKSTFGNYKYLFTDAVGHNFYGKGE